ncbi:MAG: cytochrome c biogenesis protein ResB [Desulfobulbaceae bacterium]|nr:cytochrome c biogenesis protein ResB [Desulfobulbaceae bacterium]
MNLLNQIWDFFASVKLAIFTLCTLATTSIIGTIIPQGEAVSFYVKNYGPKSARFMQTLDIPEMYYSWWFIGLLGILSTNLLICSFERFPRVWKMINADNFKISPERLAKMSSSRQWLKNDSSFDPTKLFALLNSNGWRGSSKKVNDGTLYFSQKGKWSRTGVYIVHLSILVIFTGAIVGHFQGFKGSVMIPERSLTEKIFSSKDSSSFPLGFEVRCNNFTIEFYDNGMPKDYRSSLTILENGEEILTRDIEVNDPLTYKGITFYQSSYQGYQDFIFQISEKQSGDTKVFSLPFQKQLSWEDKDLRFGIVNAEALGQRVVRSKIWFKKSKEPAVIEWLADNDTITMDVSGKQYEIKAKQKYATGLQVAKDPGVWIVYVGCALMMIGLYMAFFMSHKRIWLSLKSQDASTEINLAGNANKNRLAFNKEFKKLEDILENNLKG